MIKEFLYSRLPSFPASVCHICFSPIQYQTATFPKTWHAPFHIKNHTLTFRVCTQCGFSFCPENYKDYTQKKVEISAPQSVPRVGDGIVPGREYHMAAHTIDSTRKEKLSVAIFGAGLNKDHILIRSLPKVSECYVIDLKNFQETEYFLPITTQKKFDIVIVCEVVEHFMHPRKEFYQCFQKLNKDGILIASTNIKRGSNFSNTAYPFFYGHTSYYTPRSLSILARANGMFLDFRTPQIALVGNNSKRYMYFTRSKETYQRIHEYFACINIPPSEFVGQSRNIATNPAS